MKIVLEFTEREQKILNAMCEILDEPDAKKMIEKVLSEKWKDLKTPKTLDFKTLGEKGLKKIIEHIAKNR